MVFDRALADAEVGGDVFAGLAGEHQLHDLALARGQASKVRCCRLPPNRQLGRISNLLQGMLDAGEEFVAADRLLDEIRSPGSHGLDRRRHIALAGDHDGRKPHPFALKPLQQREPAHTRHPGVDQQALVAAGTISIEEGLGAVVDLDRPAISPEQITQRLAQRAVIIDHEDGRRLRTVFGNFRRLPDACWRRRARFSEAAPDQNCQIPPLHRFIEV